MTNRIKFFWPLVALAGFILPSTAGCQPAPKNGDNLSVTTTAGAAPKVLNSASIPQVDFQNAAEYAVKAVVHVKTATKARTVVARDPFAEMFGNGFGGAFDRQYYMPPQKGSGSGVVISPDGYIVTNNHVIAGADKVTVTFNDRYTTVAKVIGTDPSTDIAVLKVNEKDLPYIRIANSDDVKLGQWVLAVGYPLTLDATVTAGIVSAKSRSIGINRQQSSNAIESFIQTDAAVNPGNSGGALVNTNGDLIGINSAIASPTGSYAGYSYAIPSNIVRKIADDIIQYGSAQRAYLGIQYLDMAQVTPEQLQEIGISRNSGVYVAGVANGTGAAVAGLQKGDFITSVNGVAVKTEPELLEQIARYKPGDRVDISYTRNKEVKNVKVELKNAAGNTAIVKKSAAELLLGADMRSLTQEEKKQLGIKTGLLLENILPNGALAQQTNVKKGFVITDVDDMPVSTVAELNRNIESKEGIVKFGGFYPGNRGTYYFNINMKNIE